MMTVETEVIFPKRTIDTDKNNLFKSQTVSSIFGLHGVVASNTDMTFDANDTINFKVVAVKEDNDVRSIKFGLRTTGASPIFADLTNSNSYQLEWRCMMNSKNLQNYSWTNLKTI